MSEEFSLEELHKLVDEALVGGSGRSGDQSQPSNPGTSPRPGGRIPLAFNEGKLLEELSRVLPRYIDQADVQVVLNDLREHLYSGIPLTDLRHMHSVTLNCRRCPMVKPSPILPRGNLVNPDVVFVLENLDQSAAIWEYFDEAAVKAGFDLHRIAVTGLTRCPLSEFRPPTAEEVTNCGGYLTHEIQSLRPKAIVAMGGATVTMLLGGPNKISEVRGHFHWIGPWAILPTFSPGYAMRGRGGIDFAADLAKAHKFAYGER